MKVAVWLAIASTSAAAVGPAGIVLCVNASGHVEIEAVGDDCCGKQPLEGEIAHTERCGCVDTPLLQNATRFTIGTEHLMSAWTMVPVASFDPPAVHAIALAIHSHRLSAPRWRESVTLSSLRSIVLLA
jgi:hypothetical protein